MQESEFYYFGQYVTMSIAQGGPGFPFLAEPVYHYIASGKCDGSLIDVSDIPDPTLQFVVEKVTKTSVVVDSLLVHICTINIHRSKQQKTMMI